MIKSVKLVALLFFIAVKSNAAKIETIWVFSKSMNKSVPNIVITPSNYPIYKGNFPVLYLLHGATDNYKGWLIIAPELPEYADQYHMIIVCPDGGVTSWYFDSPVDNTMRYETYITKELTAVIETKYKTIATKQGRAIDGLSMGGHGAFYLSFRHPDFYGAAGSISGGVDIRPFKNEWDLTKRLGTYAEHPANWEKNTVVNMLDLLNGKKLSLIFDCGTEDFFHACNQKLHLELLSRKIKHSYSERPGSHTPDYWNKSIKIHVLFFHDYFSGTQKE